jgi:stage IV sporulation protein FB
MPWSITVARVAGSEIRIHLTFLILLLWIAIASYVEGGGAAAIDGVLFIVAVFACVVLHELGHALAARRYGITTPDITLLPIGGLARLSRIPEKPGEEIVIALAGPAVNVVIAVVLIAILGARFDPATLATIESPAPGFLARLATVNIFLVVFNLIPAFPMDGGRVLRALLAFRLGRRRATAIAALIGQGLAFFFGFLGLMSGNPILVFIAIFVFLAAAAESGDVGMREAARRVPVDRAMITKFESLGTGATVDDAADALIRTTQREFPVVDGGGHLRGFLGRDAMIKALKSSGPGTPVIDVMAHRAPTLRSGEPLERALQLMQENQASELGVLDGSDRLIGYVSRENLAEFMMVGDAGADSGSGPWQRRRAPG